MSQKEKIRKIRNKLIRNCDDLATKLEKVSRLLLRGEAHDNVQKAYNDKDTGIGPTNIVFNTSGIGLSELRVLIHAALVQEWHIFLESVFAEVTHHFLKGKQESKLPKIKFQLKGLELKNINQLRKSISYSVKASYSFLPYKQRIGNLCKLLDVTIDSNLRRKMEDHVTIRNIFQHNRGVIKPEDLPECGYFELIDDNGIKRKYREKDQLVISQTDIDNLNQIIKDCSQKYEV